MKRLVLLVSVLVGVHASSHAFTVFLFPNVHWDTWFQSGGEVAGSPEQGEFADLIETSLRPLTKLSTAAVAGHLGDATELPGNFFLLPSGPSGLAVSNPQANGEPKFSFFRIDDDFGLLVLQLSGNETISGSTLYLNGTRIGDEAFIAREKIESVLGIIRDRCGLTEPEARPGLSR